LKWRELLKRIYYDPKRGLGSAEKLYREANAESGGLKISHATVKAWLEKQSVHQRFRHVKATYMPIVGKPGAVQADLTFHGWRKDLIPILTVIDLTSRYAWAVVLNKEGPTVSKAFEKILETERGKKIKIIAHLNSLSISISISISRRTAVVSSSPNGSQRCWRITKWS
jgi:hypothetical protein